MPRTPSKAITTPDVDAAIHHLIDMEEPLREAMAYMAALGMVRPSELSQEEADGLRLLSQKATEEISFVQDLFRKAHTALNG